MVLSAMVRERDKSVGLLLGPSSPYGRLIEIVVAERGSWQTVVITCKTCFTSVNDPDNHIRMTYSGYERRVTCIQIGVIRMIMRATCYHESGESSSMEANISPAIANPNALSSTRFVPINFNHSLSVKLDNKNFLIWKQQIVSAIRGYGLQKFVFSDDEVPVQFLTREDARSGKATKEFLEWEQQDQLLLSWLLSSVSESILPRLVGCDTSFLLWGRLEQYFASQTRAKAKQFKTQLQHTKKGGSTIDEYLAKIKVCVDSLASVGVSLSTKDHVESILDGLPNDYESFVTSVILRNDDFSVEEIEALLMAHESRVEKNNSSLDSSPSAHVASSNAVEKGNRFKQDYYAANSQGNHSGYNGSFGRGGDFGRRGGFNGGRGFNWNYNGRSNRGGFRGRGNRGNFQARPPWNSDNQNEKPACQLCGKIGHVVAQCYYRFDHTFQVPQNLSGRNPSPRAYFSFSPQINGVIPTSEAFSDDNWYPDSGASNHVTPNPANLMKSAEFAGQNQVHVGNGTGLSIKHIGQSEFLSPFSSKPLLLNHLLHVTQAVLMVGKVRDGLYAFDSSHLALRPTQSLSKSPSVCTASLSSTFDLWHKRNKSEAIKTFVNFKTQVELQFDLKIKSLQTDWGGEFRAFQSYLAENGIVHRVSCPHTQQQNGVAERKHRTIVEYGLTLLHTASLPLKFWDESFRTVVYLSNRLPTAVLHHKCPIEVLFKSIPDYSFLKVFGCSCFPNLRPYNTHKLQYRSEECTFLGYSLKHKGYKCMSSNGRVYISRDVIFNETSFPYSKTIQASSCLPSTVSPSTSHLSPSASPPILSPTMLPAPTSPISSARPISEMDNIVSTHPHAPNSADTTLTPAQVVSNPVATPVQHVISSIADASVTRTIAKDADNTHPMITRAKSGIVKPKIFIAAVREPSSVSAALQQDEWKKAMVAEYDALQRNNTWSLVPLPAGRQAIGCKWVYKTKENPDGTVQKYKARLVAKGFHQQAGFDFTETFSPVVKPSTIRVVFTIALSRNWAIKQLDVNNAFLNGDLLHKALYGLKQAPRAWFEKLHQALLSFGFVSAKSDQSLFLRFTPSHITYVLVYVDDILVTGSDTAAITSLIAQLNSEFSLKDLGEVHYFLGIQVSHTNNGLHLSQTKYIRDLLQKTKMVHCKPARTPLPTGLKLRAGDGDPVEDLHGYRSTVGALQYVTITRPELSFSVNKVCQFMQNPTEEHWKAVKRILRYLQGTLQHGLHLKKSSNLDLIGFCDADWASDLDDRRSTSGHCVFLGPNLISWQSKKQHTVSRSSTEAEYRSLAGLVAEITWLRSLLSELQLPLAKPPLVWCDNLSTVLLSANPVLHARTKHIELDLYFVREKVIRKEVEVRHVPSADQLADVLTKTVSSTQFIEFRHKLRIENLSTLSLRGDVRED
ncbi:Retrovirus-related Pol polyprotein from transposon RE1 [Vitis vinifera]|uniref:Retrovirus-related Pol polyprotein from transposon RE1 n=1 Tax=Vitis vinifera TaxID=29760 RepID=A0A438E6R6_VITVI|nr:Retrovirus-related Pol polyprotein from transposon RE1 [Vitis vinifera]